MLVEECEAIVEEEYLERLDKCVVGTPTRVIEVVVLTDNLTALGVSNISAKFYGNHFLVEFDDYNTLKKMEGVVLVWLGQWLSNIHPWLREFVSRCRIVGLVCLGNPSHAGTILQCTKSKVTETDLSYVHNLVDGFHAVCDSQDREANVDASSRHLEANSEVKGMPNGDSIISDGSATQSLMQRCQGTFNVMLETENEAGREINGIEEKGLDNGDKEWFIKLKGFVKKKGGKRNLKERKGEDKGVIMEQCIGGW
ncbi:hypothetical protein PVK06_033869 [Gossypium arboreum]|uniref:Uncharacterized protein n=1 Tax=Gossypium arboreum TaxID=29729 RepID=A0ABR0NCM7_GOSAR|nr:hypothetical protein PVK06_033869 [Gossypium arboreum]